MPDLSQYFSQTIVRWLVAVAAVGVCTAVNIVFQPLVDNSAPFLPYFLGVSFVAFQAGRGPGFFSLLLSAATVSYFWVEPSNGFFVYSPAQQLSLAAFVVVGGVMVLLAVRAREGIEESRQLAAALLASEKRLRGAVDMGQLGVYEWNLEGNRLSGDARYMGLWGLRPEDEMTVVLHEDAIHPDDRALRDAARAQSMDPHGDGVFQAQFRVRAYDSVERWVAVRGQVLFRDGRPVRYVGVVRDISGERLVADELRESERRSRLLADLTEATRMLSDPREICLAALGALREHLGADRCAYA
jgi:PAS domain S-box-containing protein